MLQDDHSQSTSQTAAIADHLALYGATPSPDETDSRILPCDDQIDLAMIGLFSTIQDLLSDSQLEDDIEEILWSITNVFHRRITSISKRLDDNNCKLRELLEVQDASEVKSVELECIQNRSEILSEHVSSYETMRDIAAQHFVAITGSNWLPRTGSRISNRNLTASVVDSKSYLMAKRRKENETLCPEGTRIAFAGGDYQNHELIWNVLDATKAKYPDMILLHGGAPKSAETIASKWADNRGVTQVVFRPDWNNHGRAAPFKRNDKMLNTVPQGVIATPGSGITERLVVNAKKLGIKVKRIGC